jgi:hypothetical protein
MTTKPTLLETALHQELIARGVTCLSVEDCRTILSLAYARAARMNREQPGTQAEFDEMTRRAT